MKNINWNAVEDWKEAKKVLPGGYVCKITKVEDNEAKEYLKINFDIAEGEFKGTYTSIFDSKGYWSMGWYQSYKETMLSRFKGFKTAVEQSNRGYVFKNDPESLVGKLVGLVLGEEDYINNKGDFAKRLYVAMVRSAESIRKDDFTVPQAKTLEETPNKSNVPF